MKHKHESLTVYYDGTCPMCTTFKEQSEKHTDQDVVQFVDVHTGTIPESLQTEDLLSEMRIVDDSGRVLKGSDSIFAVLEKTTQWSWLGKIGNLPIIKQCARPVYRLIAAQRHFIFGPLSRLFWIRTLVILGLLTGMLISLPLWVGDRIIPLVPVVTLPAPETLSIALFIILIPVLLWALLSP